jgi:hypothetical protein
VQLRENVRKFEACEYALAEFSHARHLAVAACYLKGMPFEAALDRMRASLLRFTAHHGVSGYHETITRFWLLLVDQYLRTLPAQLLLPDQVNQLIAQYPTKQVLFDYYSRDRVMSEAARQHWTEPDLAPLPVFSPSQL